MSAFDPTPLRRALAQFEAALREVEAEPGRTLLRDGLLQRFEFTYGLCDVLLRRYLDAASRGGEDFDRMNFPEVIRTASEQGLLLSGWDVWEGYRKARNKTSHTYSETIAVEIVALLPDFLKEVTFLLQQFEARPL